jgi:hypothetical protein
MDEKPRSRRSGRANNLRVFSEINITNKTPMSEITTKETSSSLTSQFRYTA